MLGIVDRRCVGERGAVVDGARVARAVDVGDGLISVHVGDVAVRHRGGAVARRLDDRPVVRAESNGSDASR